MELVIISGSFLVEVGIGRKSQLICSSKSLSSVFSLRFSFFTAPSLVVSFSDPRTTGLIDQALQGATCEVFRTLLTLNIQQVVNQRNQILLKNIILIEQFQLFNQIPKKETPGGIKATAPQLLSDTTSEADNLLNLTKQIVYPTLNILILINQIKQTRQYSSIR